MSFRKIVFDAVGYFAISLGRRSTSMIGSEESEFCLRLLNALPNAKIVYDPTAIVHHCVPSSRANTSYLVKRSFYEGYSKAMMTTEPSRSEALIPEKNYLVRLFLDQIPSCLREIYRFDRIQKLAAIILSLSAVAVGYLCFRFGRLFIRRNLEPIPLDSKSSTIVASPEI